LVSETVSARLRVSWRGKSRESNEREGGRERKIEIEREIDHDRYIDRDRESMRVFVCEREREKGEGERT
jgi:hypothetical protein